MHYHSPVVEEPPSELSTLSRIVSSDHDSRLDLANLLEAVSQANVFYRARLETLAELAALRKCKKTVSLFGTLKVGYDLSAYSKKTALELCWETIERVQVLNERIALHHYPEDRIERSGKFFYFLIQVAGIAGGDVAESKASRDEAITSLRLRDLLAEHECPNYLIKSFPDVLADSNSTFERDGRYRIAPPTKSTGQPRYAFSRCTECGTDFVDEKDKPTKKEFEFCGETAIAQGECKRTWLDKHPPVNFVKPATLRFFSKKKFDEYKEGRKDNDVDTLPRTLKNFCPELGMYIQENWQPREGSASGCSRTLVRQHVKQIAKELGEVRDFKKSAALYQRFCFDFEFPKTHDEEAMEQAAEHLIKVVPKEHLEQLLKQRKGKRHYVRHGADELSFVCQHDLNLAMGRNKCQQLA